MLTERTQGTASDDIDMKHQIWWVSESVLLDEQELVLKEVVRLFDD
jgi:hypothetical protein